MRSIPQLLSLFLFFQIDDASALISFKLLNLEWEIVLNLSLYEGERTVSIEFVGLGLVEADGNPLPDASLPPSPNFYFGKFTVAVLKMLELLETWTGRIDAASIGLATNNINLRNALPRFGFTPSQGRGDGVVDFGLTLDRR